MQQTIPFIDLETQQARIKPQLDARLARVLAHGGYIMGPEIEELEAALVSFCDGMPGDLHAISCASGTDALVLALMALKVQPGDVVLVPTFTFAATAEVVPLLGAVPVFLDILPDSFNVDPQGVTAGVEAARQAGLRPVGIIAVDLFGQPADYDALHQAAAAHGMWLIADAAQSFGASLAGRKVGQLARITTTSFFPAKPLGCYGDGGAVFTDDAELASTMRSLRVHGQGTDKYDNVRIGLNARLDTLQAAVLLAKLQIFSDEILARQRVADRYGALLTGLATPPKLGPEATSTWAQYTLRSGAREQLRQQLAAAGIPSAIYYPRPLHQQTAYRGFPVVAGGCPVAEQAAGEVLSLPMHPYLDAATQERIVAALRPVRAAAS